MNKWKQIKLCAPEWQEWHLDLVEDGMLGKVWRASIGLWRAVVVTSDGTRHVCAPCENSREAAIEACEAQILVLLNPSAGEEAESC